MRTRILIAVIFALVLIAAILFLTQPTGGYE